LFSKTEIPSLWQQFDGAAASIFQRVFVESVEMELGNLKVTVENKMLKGY
jgi:hypothetical protein